MGEDTAEQEPNKPAIVRKALGVTVMVFFFSLILFVGVVVVLVKFATKGGSA